MNAVAGLVPFVAASHVDLALPRLSEYLRAGGLIAYPTETVYGLGGAPTVAAVDALRMLKGRIDFKSFLLLVSGMPMIGRMGLSLNDAAEALAERFWPGPLTLVLSAAGSALPEGLHESGGGVAVRWTSCRSICRLIEFAESPITSTSANPPGFPPALEAAGVMEYFKEDVQAGRLCVLDGGPLLPSPPSTIVDCTGNPPRVVRHGAIDIAQLRGTLPDLLGIE